MRLCLHFLAFCCAPLAQVKTRSAAADVLQQMVPSEGVATALSNGTSPTLPSAPRPPTLPSHNTKDLLTDGGRNELVVSLLAALLSSPLPQPQSQPQVTPKRDGRLSIGSSITGMVSRLEVEDAALLGSPSLGGEDRAQVRISAPGDALSPAIQALSRGLTPSPNGYRTGSRPQSPNRSLMGSKAQFQLQLDLKGRAGDAPSPPHPHLPRYLMPVSGCPTGDALGGQTAVWNEVEWGYRHGDGGQGESQKATLPVMPTLRSHLQKPLQSMWTPLLVDVHDAPAAPLFALPTALRPSRNHKALLESAGVPVAVVPGYGSSPDAPQPALHAPSQQQPPGAAASPHSPTPSDLPPASPASPAPSQQRSTPSAPRPARSAPSSPASHAPVPHNNSVRGAHPGAPAHGPQPSGALQPAIRSVQRPGSSTRWRPAVASFEEVPPAARPATARALNAGRSGRGRAGAAATVGGGPRSAARGQGGACVEEGVEDVVVVCEYPPSRAARVQGFKPFDVPAVQPSLSPKDSQGRGVAVAGDESEAWWPAPSPQLTASRAAGGSMVEAAEGLMQALEAGNDRRSSAWSTPRKSTGLAGSRIGGDRPKSAASVVFRLRNDSAATTPARPRAPAPSVAATHAFSGYNGSTAATPRMSALLQGLAAAQSGRVPPVAASSPSPQDHKGQQEGGVEGGAKSGWWGAAGVGVQGCGGMCCGCCAVRPLCMSLPPTLSVWTLAIAYLLLGWPLPPQHDIDISLSEVIVSLAANLHPVHPLLSHPRTRTCSSHALRVCCPSQCFPGRVVCASGARGMLPGYWPAF